MDVIRRLWYVTRRRWLVVLLIGVLCLGGGFAYAMTQSPKYTASVSVFLRAPDVKTSVSAYQGDLFSRQRAQTYVNIIDSDELAQRVINELDLHITPDALAAEMSADVVKDTVIIGINATDASAQHAADLANAYASVFGSYVAEVENVQNDPRLPPLVTVIRAADAPSAARDGFGLGTILLSAAVLWVVLSAFAAWLIEHVDTTLRSRAQIENASGVPVLGSVSGPGEPGNEVDSIAVAIRQRLIVADRAAPEGQAPVVAVVSDRDDSGAIELATSTADALSASGRRIAVLAVGVARDGTHGSPGRVLEPTDPESLVVTYHVPTAESDEIAIAKALVELRSGAEMVIIATPMLVDTVIAANAVAQSDGCVAVVRQGRSDRVGLRRIVHLTEQLGRPLLGVVVTYGRETSTLDGVYR